VPSWFESVVEPVAPARLGRSFRWLLASQIISNAGDGIALSAGPLLVASQTRDPLLVSMALLAEVLPKLLFGVLAGAAADRTDRRRLVVGMNAGRAIVLAALAATIASGTVNIAVILAALFILGTAETFADVGGSSLLPRLVRREDLGIANARMQGAQLLTNQLLTPPIGAFLFAAGMALPFATNAACFALGAVLVLRVVTSPADAPGDEGDAAHRRPSLRADMAEGLRWPDRPSADANPRPHDLHVQCHVRSRVVGARPVRRRAAGDGRRWLRPHHDGDRRRRAHRWRILRAPGAEVLARQHHAGRPPDRDCHPI